MKTSQQRLPAGSQSPSTARRGLTILEVMIALAIFLGSFIALGQLISNGATAYRKGTLQTEAAFRAESVVAEIAAGIAPLQATSETPFADDTTGAWTYSVEMLETTEVDLLAYVVIVNHTNNQGNINATFRAQRFLRDPQIYLDAADAAADAEAGSSSGAL